MEYTVKQLATLCGLTPRALRWYDKIGLLCPARGKNGYRLYGAQEIARLQQIMLYRQSGMELADIACILNNPAFEAEHALRGHLAEMRRRREALDALINTAERTLAAMKGAIVMTDNEKFEGFKKKRVDENETIYGKEVRERWGDEAANDSNARMLSMSKDEYDAFEKLGDEVLQALADAVATGNPAGAAAQKAADLHRQWLSAAWGREKYTAEAHKSMCQMYVDDERFSSYYEKAAAGAAAFLRDAVAIYTERK